jgi:hypothetical protein|tara:strand:+ start:38 stop:394 length:357 start_codon:yes stop_codon:yes gene_type:complete
MSYSSKRKQFRQEKKSLKEQENLEKHSSILVNVSKKRFQTVFVGAVSKIEKCFGSLWGDDELNEDEMTPEQLSWYKKFLDLRDEIFDQGNEQKNKFEKDVQNFDIIYKGYKIEIRKKI